MPEKITTRQGRVLKCEECGTQIHGENVGSIKKGWVSHEYKEVLCKSCWHDRYDKEKKKGYGGYKDV